MKLNINSNVIIEEAKATVKERKFVSITLIFIFIYLLVALLMVLGNLAFLLIYGLFNENAASVLMNSSETLENSFTPMVLAFNVLLIIVPVLYCTRFERRRLFTLGFTKEGAITEYLSGLLIGLAMFSVSFIIIYIFGGFKALELNDQIPWRFIILMFLGYIIQGLAEEVLIRGYYMVSLAVNGNLPFAIFASSFVFSLLHIGNDGLNAIGMINLFLFGIFAALYFIRRGSIWGIAAMHTMWNFTQGNIFGCAVSGHTTKETIILTNQNENLRLINGGKFGPEGGIAVTLVLIVGIVILYFMKNKERNFGIE